MILVYVIRMRWLIWYLSHPDGLAILSISSGWLVDIAGCHPDNLRYFPISPGRHNVIWTGAHPDDLWTMHCVIRMTLTVVGTSSGWVTAFSLCHPDDIPFHLMSSGWLNWGWYLIRISYHVIRMRYASFRFFTARGGYTRPRSFESPVLLVTAVYVHSEYKWKEYMVAEKGWVLLKVTRKCYDMNI